jgi:hypothetical protein
MRSEAEPGGFRLGEFLEGSRITDGFEPVTDLDLLFVGKLEENIIEVRLCHRSDPVR